MTDNTWPTVDTELIDDVTLYSAKLIIPVTGPVIIDGAVAIHGDRVVHVGKRRWVLKALKQEMTAHGTIHERHWDGVLTPGLINAHTHLQYSGMVQVGQGTYDRFRAWELAFNEVYAEAQKTQPWKQWAEDGARQMVESGTTAAADIVTDLDAAGAGHARHRLLGGNGLAQRRMDGKGPHRAHPAVATDERGAAAEPRHQPACSVYAGVRTVR